MAAVLAPNQPTILPTAAIGGVNKRYRPAPAKTFQCRGYGECRMVFSRSEHLARHIRKHTGERPFTCHCGKQFSRLDNLRQHAQTVHADKQDQNDRMMRDLTTLHASMAAANKSTQTRGKQRPNQSPTQSSMLPASHHSTTANEHGLRGLDQVKEEDDMSSSSLPMHQRPGTSTGYEGGNDMMYQSSWNTGDFDRGPGHSHPRPPNNHSFRDSSQSFRVPPASTSSTIGQQSQSFLPFSNTFSFSVPPRDGRPGSSHSRPPTTGGLDQNARTLPPLSAVVSATVAPPPSAQQPFPLPPQSTQHILPLSGASAFTRRPSTATRPGTAPASYFGSKPAYAGGPGLVYQSELPLPSYGGRSVELATAGSAAAYHAGYDAEPPSPTTGAYDSPFSFHPPAISEQQPGSFAAAPANPRKRPHPGSDDDDGPRGVPAPGEYDYGSESRPQSRRLTVMELCNDSDADAGLRPPTGTAATATAGGGASRPTTSSGLVSSASNLALVDRSPSGSSVFAGVTLPAIAATSPAA
ncbi:hypothetical protein CONPUDRAFT_118852, partial [Coniophora puteana RWD-64-598 SS2]